MLVTFELSSGIALMSPASGTALTDSNGIAQIGLKSAGEGSGAAELSAKAVVVNSKEITAKAAFSVGATPSSIATAINFQSAAPSDKSIVIKGPGGNERTEVALLTFNVVDSSNSGVPNTKIDFQTQSTRPVTLVSTSGTTDANGNVSVAVNSGTEPTTVRVVATVRGTAISALSDTLTVTTGQPTQSAFSLSLNKYYVEGFDYDNTQITASVLLADSFGAAVADGTQVVFSTDSGAIVGTGGARCLTTQGGCSVIWRSQNPRSSNGQVTILATATNDNENLAVETRFFNSGSFGKGYRVSSNSSQGATTRDMSSGPFNLDFTTSCEPQSVRIEVVDQLGNPMPEGTTITGADSVNASLTAFPPTVLRANLPFGSATRGTVHDLRITPSGCDLAGTKSKAGSILLVLQTPLGTSTSAVRIDLGTFNGS